MFQRSENTARPPHRVYVSLTTHQGISILQEEQRPTPPWTRCNTCRQSRGVEAAAKDWSLSPVAPRPLRCLAFAAYGNQRRSYYSPCVFVESPQCSSAHTHSVTTMRCEASNKGQPCVPPPRAPLQTVNTAFGRPRGPGHGLLGTLLCRLSYSPIYLHSLGMLISLKIASV